MPHVTQLGTRIEMCWVVRPRTSFWLLYVQNHTRFLPQRTQSGFTKDTRRRVDSSRLVIIVGWHKLSQMTIIMWSTLRFVSFVKPLCVRCGKKRVAQLSACIHSSTLRGKIRGHPSNSFHPHDHCSYVGRVQYAVIE